ncbi:MAG: PAS domain S-box protein [Verrucomicrobia bacterium]|nr:MAG: PAS domain S-box protein [Verrucomicrobiota bacterium]
MKTTNHNSSQPITFPQVAGLGSAAVGLFVLAGWGLNIPWIKSVLPGAVTMKANTAIGLLLAGMALWLLDKQTSPGLRRLGQGLAVLVALIGLATIGEYAYGWRLGIDELLFRDTADAYSSMRGRMSPYSAVAFAALGLGLALLPLRPMRWFVLMTANLTILIGGVSFIGYLWNASELVTDRLLPPVAVNTAAVFILLGIGTVLTTRPPAERTLRKLVSFSSVEVKTLAGFLATLLLLLLMGGHAYRSAVEAAKSARSVSHTRQVRASLDRLYASISDAESQQRNYLLTGKREFLEESKHYADEAGQKAKSLADLIADNPEQLQKLKELQVRVDQRLAVLAVTTAVFEQSGLAAAQQRIASGEGRELMLAIRSLIGEMDAVEEGLLNTRSTDSATKQFATLLSLLATLAVATAGFMVLYSGIRRELAKRTEAEAERDQERARLKFIFDSVPIGISYTITAADGRMTNTINDEHLRICGLIREQVAVPGIFKKITEPEDHKRQAVFTKRIEAGEIDHYSMDKRYVWPDGQNVWVFFSFQRRRHTGGWHEDLSIVVDISERKRMEEALRQSEENLSVTLHSIGDAVLATDPEGRVTRMNRVAENLTGWTLAEAQGRPIAEVFQIINEQTRQPAVIPVDKVLETGEIHGLANHTVLIARNGTERPIADSASPIRDRDGRILGVVLVFRDVLEEKKAERTVRESEARYRTLFDSIDEGYCIIEIIFDGQEKPVDYRFLEINPSFERQTGLHDALGKRMRELAPQHEAHWFEIYGRIALTGEPARFQNRAEQLHRWFDVYAFRFGDPKNRQVAILFNDITARKRSEEELRKFNVGLEELVAKRTAEVRQQEELNRRLLENLTEGVVACDAEGRLSLFNRVAREWHGADLSDVPSEQWSAHFNLCAADGRTPLAATEIPLARAFRGERVSNVEMSIVRKNAPPLCVLASGVPLFDASGKKCGAVVVMRDITERRKHERLALRSQRLESLGTLAGGIAHDLNNALAPILMVVEMLKLQYPDESQMLETIGSSARRGADMVRQLLTFAKGAEGERVAINPKHLLRELENIMRSTFPKNITVEIKLDDDLAVVLGDATQLHQVLVNLCVNARDAMPHGGTLTLEAASLEVDAVYASSIPDAKPGKYVRLRVRDTGTGIAPEILDRIFDPFFTTKGPDKGSGLGLSTVLGIVKGHGGFMQVYSSPGQGSTFAVYLPASDTAADTTRVSKAEAEFRGQGETILLVDDEAAVREMGRAVLRRLNFKPVTATDGADGLMQLAEHRADLRAIITDLHMPHMDGFSFIRALRRMRRDIPVVVTSGRLDEKDKAELSLLGVTACLDKPFTEGQLAEALKKLLSAK